MKRALLILLILACAAASQRDRSRKRIHPTVDITTWHMDNARSGANTNETSLTPGNVNTNTFGLLSTVQVDGAVFAQPLLYRGKVYVATEHNSVYCFDAIGNMLWKNTVAIATNPVNVGNPIGMEVGITSTPVIDPDTALIYVETFSAVDGVAEHQLHVLSTVTGVEPLNPVTINPDPSFLPDYHLQRAALTLANNIVYVGFAGYQDQEPYSGWVVGFDKTTLGQVAAWNPEPTGTFSAGVWMSGGGPGVDSAGNLYLATGNGLMSSGLSYGDSIVKLDASLHVLDWFSPSNQEYLAQNDVDQGSSPPVLISANLLVQEGKSGIMFVLNRDDLGGYDTNQNRVTQQWLESTGVYDNQPAGLYGAVAFFNDMMYVQAALDVMKAYRFTGTGFETVPLSTTRFASGYPGATPVVSANGTNNAILWYIQGDTGTNAAVLHALNPYNLTQEYWNSALSGKDAPGPPTKFCVPAVANGKVYVGSKNRLSIYGLKSL